MESFGQNWVVLPNWASWKLGKLLWSGREGQNFELYCLFFFWKVNWFRLKLSLEFPVMTLKGYGQFGAKLNAPSQFSLLKSWKISLEWARRSKFLSLLVSFFWKLNWFRVKLSLEFPVMTLKGYGRFQAKLNGASQFRLLKTWKTSLEWARRSKFLTVLLIFFLKAKLIQVETFTGVSCHDTEKL